MPFGGAPGGDTHHAASPLRSTRPDHDDTRMPPSVRVANLTRRFGEITAVGDVSFEVGEAEIFGFLGPNGAGKTTTISMLCTLLTPTAGQAYVGGHEIREDPGAVRREIGIVFQDSTVDERLTARENLVFHGELFGMPRTEIRPRAEQLLERVGLADRADDAVLTFSGGMRRRLEVARGLMHWPSVLFLDEPTVGLDPQTRRSLWAYARSLRETEGVTIFLTTHYMDEAEACDRVAIMDYGKNHRPGHPGAPQGDAGRRRRVRIRRGQRSARTRGARIVRGRATHRERSRGVQRSNVAVTSSPVLLARLTNPVQSVGIRAPTLEDVFVSLTGHQIRDSSFSEQDKFRSVQKRGFRRMR